MHHIMNGGQLPQAFGGPPEKDSATGGEPTEKKRDAANWSSYETYKRENLEAGPAAP